jgi:hypothetical protein
MKPALGLIIGLACYCVVGWVLNSGLLDPIIAAGLMFWLLGALVLGALLLLAWLVRFLLRAARNAMT